MVAGVLQLGEQFSCPELVEKAMTVLTQRFSAVFLAERESFVAVSAGTFLKITQSDQLVFDTGKLFKTKFKLHKHFQ